MTLIEILDVIRSENMRRADEGLCVRLGFSDQGEAFIEATTGHPIFKPFYDREVVMLMAEDENKFKIFVRESAKEGNGSNG